MSNKLLIISGPTATGKTALAVKIAKKYNGEIISADSRQLYIGMDIGTGKDHPKNIKIHLLDLITPDQKFSVADYQKIALKKIKEIQSKNKLPILVGCSGFYVDSVINPDYQTFSIKPKKYLRIFLNKLPLKILQKLLYLLDKNTYLKLNNSDKNNSYRLIRKIELAFSKSNKAVPPLSKGGLRGDFDYLHISLTAPSSFLYPRIDQRVEERLKIGHLKEIKKLLKTYNWSDPGLQVSAYKVFQPYFLNKNKEIFNDCITRWKFLEHRDARRQKTWFKKITGNIKFIDITSSKFFNNVFTIINKWYNNS